MDIDSTAIGSDANATYTYLGASTVVKVEYPAVTNTLALTYGASSNDYPGFDRFGRVVDQKWQMQTGGAVKDEFEYAYDRTSNRISRDVMPDADPALTGHDDYYQYDALDRLMKRNRGTLSGGSITDAAANFNQAWAEDDSGWKTRLDPLGNWTKYQWDDNGGGDFPDEQDRTHNKANEITTVDDWSNPAYDDAGNMIAGPKPGDEATPASTQWYTYDAWNRLITVSQGAASPGTLVVTYSYDGQHRRIRKLIEAGETDITYDFYYNTRWQVLEVRKNESSDPDPLEQYVWGLQYIDAPVVRFFDGDQDGEIDPEDEGDSTLYYMYDGNFNVTALIGTNGVVAERYAYDPYGQVTFKTAAWADAASQAKSAYDNEILYCGYRWDPESGNYLARRRYLTPPLGTWLTNDPIGYGDGMNRYQATRSNPITCSDPSGTVIVVMSGWWRPAGDMNTIKANLISHLRPALAQYDRGVPRFNVAQMSWGPLDDTNGKYDKYPYTNIWLTGSYDDFVRSHYDDYIARKKANPCSLEQFVAIGHSSGASGILNGLTGGHLNDKNYPPAFLGLIDPVLPRDDKARDISHIKRKGQVWVYYQSADIPLLRGKPVNGADANIEVKGVKHISILGSTDVEDDMPRIGALVYEIWVQKELKQNPSKATWDTSNGHIVGNRRVGNLW